MTCQATRASVLVVMTFLIHEPAALVPAMTSLHLPRSISPRPPTLMPTCHLPSFSAGCCVMPITANRGALTVRRSAPTRSCIAATSGPLRGMCGSKTHGANNCPNKETKDNKQEKGKGKGKNKKGKGTR